MDIEEKAYERNQYPSLQWVYRWKEGSRLSKRRDLEELCPSEVHVLVDNGEVEQGDLGERGLEACYIIDEAQNFWPARSWSSTPKGLLFYLSQHRHCGDECEIGRAHV